MSETAKAKARRIREGFFDKYVHGQVIDIGCGRDPLTPDCQRWDAELGSGDATFMAGLPHECFDTVYSSHCLEHLHFPHAALVRWFELVKRNGHLILFLPDRALYEKRFTLPSNWNGDHKTFWTIDHDEPPCTFGIVPMIARYLENYRIEYVKLCGDGHTITDPSLHSDGEYSIECVIRKLP